MRTGSTMFSNLSLKCRNVKQMSENNPNNCINQSQLKYTWSPMDFYLIKWCFATSFSTTDLQIMK